MLDNRYIGTSLPGWMSCARRVAVGAIKQEQQPQFLVVMEKVQVCALWVVVDLYSTYERDMDRLTMVFFASTDVVEGFWCSVVDIEVAYFRWPALEKCRSWCQKKAWNRSSEGQHCGRRMGQPLI